MEQTNISVSSGDGRNPSPSRRGLFSFMGKLVVAALLWLVASTGEAATIPVNCDAGAKIQSKLGSAKPGDTLVVSGTCKENVDIPAEVNRINLDGQ